MILMKTKINNVWNDLIRIVIIMEFLYLKTVCVVRGDNYTPWLVHIDSWNFLILHQI